MKELISCVALIGAVSAAQSHLDPHRIFKRDLQLIKDSGILPLANATTLGKSAVAGSYTTQVYSTLNCQTDSLYTASGYVYGQCLSLDGTGYSYSDCSEGGGKTTVHMTICTASDCSSDCSTYPIAFDTGCQTMSIMSCQSSKTPWEGMGLNTRLETFWGESSCDGDFDQWTAINVDEKDCNDIECYSDESGSSDYAIQGYCDRSTFKLKKTENMKRIGDDDACAADIGAATADIAQAGIDIAAAVDDCANGFTPACNNDIDKVLVDLTNAAEHITAAVYDCGGGEPTPCSEDINSILADVTAATEAITDAVISCPINDAKCAIDITRAVVAIGKAAVDIAKAANDC